MKSLLICLLLTGCSYPYDGVTKKEADKAELLCADHGGWSLITTNSPNPEIRPVICEDDYVFYTCKNSQLIIHGCEEV